MDDVNEIRVTVTVEYPDAATETHVFTDVITATFKRAGPGEESFSVTAHARKQIV